MFDQIKTNSVSFKFFLLKSKNIVSISISLFAIAVKLLFFVRYKHQISLVNYAKPNQNIEVVHYNREFVITEFDCILLTKLKSFSLIRDVCLILYMYIYCVINYQTEICLFLVGGSNTVKLVYNELGC